MKIISHEVLMEKAGRAIDSAKLLFNAGDIEGACNRAYYGMFDAAKAALICSVRDIDPTIGKTHSSLISSFGQYMVKTNLIPLEFGKQFNFAHDLRQTADYSGDLIEASQVESLIDEAEKFVEWIDVNIVSSKHTNKLKPSNPG